MPSHWPIKVTGKGDNLYHLGVLKPSLWCQHEINTAIKHVTASSRHPSFLDNPSTMPKLIFMTYTVYSYDTMETNLKKSPRFLFIWLVQDLEITSKTQEGRAKTWIISRKADLKPGTCKTAKCISKNMQRSGHSLVKRNYVAFDSSA
jgi:hypothetical protein